MFSIENSSNDAISGLWGASQTDQVRNSGSWGIVQPGWSRKRVQQDVGRGQEEVPGRRHRGRFDFIVLKPVVIQIITLCYFQGGGDWGSIVASHPAPLGLNPSSADIFSLQCLFCKPCSDQNQYITKRWIAQMLLAVTYRDKHYNKIPFWYLSWIQLSIVPINTGHRVNSCRRVMLTSPSCKAKKQWWNLPRTPSCLLK